MLESCPQSTPSKGMVVVQVQEGLSTCQHVNVVSNRSAPTNIYVTKGERTVIDVLVNK